MATRRSRSIRLALMGTVGLVGTLPLAGCDSGPEAQAFRTVQECIDKTGQDQTCREAEAAARALSNEVAPAFRDQAACEAAFGSCAPARALPSREQADAAVAMGDAPPAAAAAPAAGGGSWFLPAAAGFLMGRALGGPPTPYYMRRDGGAVAFNGARAQPLDPRWLQDPQARDRQSSFTSRTGSSSSSFYRGSSRSGSSSVTSSPSRSGGFGSSARASGGSSGG